MKKTRVLAALLSVAMCLLLAACDQAEDPGAEVTPSGEELVQGETLSAPTDFEFDPVTGEYSFNATDPNAGTAGTGTATDPNAGTAGTG